MLNQATDIPKTSSILLSGAVLFIIAMALFIQTQSYDLVWDDLHLVQEVSKRISQENLLEILQREFELGPESPTPLGYYRPIVLLSLWLDSLMNAAGFYTFHTTNILLHSINTTLFFLLLVGLTNTIRFPFFSSLIFAVHPVHTESIAFVSGRTDLLACLFILLTLIFYYNHFCRSDRFSMLLVPLSLLSYGLACLSKEVSFPLPFAIILFHYILCSANGRKPLVLKDLLPFGGMIGVLILIILFRTAHLGIGLGQPHPEQGLLFSGKLLKSSAVLINYIRILVFPFDLKPLYGLEDISFNFLTIVGGVFFAILCLSGLSEKARRFGVIAFVWTIGFLLPVSGVVRISSSIMAERFLYIPSLGFSALLSAFVVHVFQSTPRRFLSHGLIMALCILFVGKTFDQSQIWIDEKTLFRQATRSSPDNPLGYVNLGTYQMSKGLLREAEKNFITALKRDPDFWLANYNLGVALTRTNRHREAIRYFEKSVNLMPRYYKSRHNLGLAYLMDSRIPEAIEQLERAVELNPGDPYVRADIINAYLVSGNALAAKKHYYDLSIISPATAKFLAPYFLPGTDRP